MRLTPGEAVFGILAVVLIGNTIRTWRRDRREGAPPLTPLSRVLTQHDHREQFRRDYQDGVAAGARDTLSALIEAAREHPEQTIAWGTPAKCGCQLCCDRAGKPFFIPCATHEQEDGDFERWKAELEDTR